MNIKEYMDKRWLLPSDVIAELITYCRENGKDFESALIAARVYAEMDSHKELLATTEAL